MNSYISNKEQQLSYAKYYDWKMTSAPEELVSKVNEGPIDSNQTISIYERNRLLDPGYLETEIGYCCMEDGTGFVASRILMPGVTNTMFDWWFVWHAMEPLRYKIWNKEDHFGIQTDQRERLLDSSIPIPERIWGVTHIVEEDTGSGPRNIRIRFCSPESMGFDLKKLKLSNTSSLLCANGDDAVMVHYIRPVEGGVELRSRFWLGYNIDLQTKEPKKIIPDHIQVPLEETRSLLLHCIKEYTHLGKLLPVLYKEEKCNL